MKNSTENPAVTNLHHYIGECEDRTSERQPTADELREKVIESLRMDYFGDAAGIINEMESDKKYNFTDDEILEAIRMSNDPFDLARCCLDLFREVVETRNNLGLRTEQLELSMKQTDKLIAVVKDYEDLNK